MSKILVVGSINMDLTIETERMLKLGETISGKNFKTLVGGKGANQAVAASRLGGDVKFLGAVGEDSYGKELLENLENENIKFEGSVLEGTTTGIAVITVCGGDNCIILDGGANMKITPDTVRAKRCLFEWADFVVFQLEIPLDTVLCGAKLARECGAKVVLNPAPAQNLPDEIYKNTDIIIPNETEAEIITGIAIKDKNDCEKAVLELRSRGVEQVIITLGDKGCVYNKESEIIFKDPIETTVVDTTAAGDSFIGSVCVALGNGKTIDEAVDYATKVSSITVSRRGASVSIPYANEIE